jgi:plasmid maintenance system antidote protein VapI
MSAEFWMNVQKKYELDVARDATEDTVMREVRPAPRASASSMSAVAVR